MIEHISHFGITNGRTPHRYIGMYQQDRMQHLYVLGKTGTGKSTLLMSLLIGDIETGRGCILLDPHGDLACAIALRIPQAEKHRLLHVDLTSDDIRYGYNPLKNVPSHLIPLAASGLLETFRHHFGEKAWGSRMEHIFRNVLYALLEYKEADLADILRMLAEKEFRAKVLACVTNPQVKYFWNVEYSKLWGSSLFEAIAPIQSKVGAFLTDPKIRRFLLDFKTPLSLRRAMDESNIVIVNLARGILGSDTSNLLGGLLTQTITLAALSRQSLDISERTPCHLYLDEFEYFLTPATATMLSETRKVQLSVTLANQYLYQLSDGVKAAVMGNVGSIISFRTGPEDARVLSRHFDDVSEMDIQNLPNHHFFVKMIIDGEPSRVFSGNTMID
jgi:Helicase HerA, central domain